MKTQIVLGAYDSVFFPVPPTKARRPDHVNGGSPYFPRVSSEPIAAGSISASTPARRDNSGLPASLADWLVCKEALDICQRGRNGMENGSDTWVVTAKPAIRGKIPPATSLRPQKES